MQARPIHLSPTSEANRRRCNTISREPSISFRKSVSPALQLIWATRPSALGIRYFPKKGVPLGTKELSAAVVLSSLRDSYVKPYLDAVVSMFLAALEPPT